MFKHHFAPSTIDKVVSENVKDKAEKTLSIKVAHKEFANIHPNLPNSHKDGWGSLIKLLDLEVAEGYIPTSIINNTSSGGSCYILSVDIKRPADAIHKDYLIKQAEVLGWESVDNGKHFSINEVKNYLLSLSKGKYSYPVVDIISSFNAKGINCTEEEVLSLIKNMDFKTFYDKRVVFNPASVNSKFMQPIPRKVEEVIFIRPIS